MHYTFTVDPSNGSLALYTSNMTGYKSNSHLSHNHTCDISVATVVRHACVLSVGVTLVCSMTH